MPRYLLALYDNPADYQDLSPEELGEVVGKYQAWTRKLESEGRLGAAEKLQDGSGRVMRGGGPGPAEVLDGPFSESKEVLGGFYLFEAAGYDEAVEVCRGCPHLAFSGTLEIREIEEMG